MKMRLGYVRLPFVLVASLWLAATVGLRSDAAPEVNAPESSAVITRLVLRDYEINISSGADGMVHYDVYSQAGQVLDANLTLDQLQARYPTVYNSLRPAIAQDSSDGPIMMMLAE